MKRLILLGMIVLGLTGCGTTDGDITAVQKINDEQAQKIKVMDLQLAYLQTSLNGTALDQLALDVKNSLITAQSSAKTIDAINTVVNGVIADNKQSVLDISGLKDDVAITIIQNGAVKADITSLTTILNEIIDKNTALSTDMATVKAQIASMLAQAGGVSADQLTQLKADITALFNQTSTSSASIATIQTSINAILTKNGLTDTRLTSIETAINAILTANSDLTANVSTLQAQMATAISNANVASDKVDALTIGFNQSLIDNAYQVSSLTDILNKTKEDLTTALTAVQSNAKTYTDTAIVDALNQSKAYTDTAITSAIATANAHGDTASAQALADAKTYTDTAITTAVATANVTTIANAKIYTDSAIALISSTLETYTDNATATASTQALADAKTYADNQLATVINNANIYTDTAVNNAISLLNGNITTAVANALNSAKIYTDTSISAILTNPAITGMQTQITSNTTAVSALITKVDTTTADILALQTAVNTADSNLQNQLDTINATITANNATVATLQAQLEAIQNSIDESLVLRVTKHGTVNNVWYGMDNRNYINTINSQDVSYNVIATNIFGAVKNVVITGVSDGPNCSVTTYDTHTDDNGIQQFSVTFNNSVSAVDENVTFSVTLQTKTVTKTMSAHYGTGQNFTLTITNNHANATTIATQDEGNGRYNAMLVCFDSVVNPADTIKLTNAISTKGDKIIINGFGYWNGPFWIESKLSILSEYLDIPQLEANGYKTAGGGNRCVQISLNTANYWTSEIPVGGSISVDIDGVVGGSITDAWFLDMQGYNVNPGYSLLNNNLYSVEVFSR